MLSIVKTFLCRSVIKQNPNIIQETKFIGTVSHFLQEHLSFNNWNFYTTESWSCHFSARSNNFRFILIFWIHQIRKWENLKLWDIVTTIFSNHQESNLNWESRCQDFRNEGWTQKKTQKKKDNLIGCLWVWSKRNTIATPSWLLIHANPDSRCRIIPEHLPVQKILWHIHLFTEAIIWFSITWPLEPIKIRPASSSVCLVSFQQAHSTASTEHDRAIC